MYIEKNEELEGRDPFSFFRRRRVESGVYRILRRLGKAKEQEQNFERLTHLLSSVCIQRAMPNVRKVPGTMTSNTSLISTLIPCYNVSGRKGEKHDH